MPKPQRSINDALAEIVATAPHVERDNGACDNGARDGAARDNLARENVARENVVRDRVPLANGQARRGNAKTRHLSADTDEDGYRTRIRREKPHVSFYAHPRVFAAIRDIAEQERCRAHDLYVEGLRMMLAKYGLDFDELDGRASA